ncbi:hypothetical protein BX600DRAFT_114923 [Xylariales sp. PMI_506]|nr:hypothetical protein BX600DRAFT_114923 [Xylariales sp. PMI_506]
MDAQNEPSRILEQARRHLEALKQAGLSREALIALLDEEDQPKQQQQLQVHLRQQSPNSLQPPQQPPPPPPTQQHQQQQQQQQQPQSHAPPAQGGGIESQLSPSYAVPSYPFIPSHQVRSSISSVASNSSGRESILSTATAQSSVSSIGGSFAKPATPSASSEAKYWCTSCDKTFKRKFDWKRHEEEFHERWRKYPCPNCNQSFWGPNTFNQHHKSAHGCKTCPHSDGVVKYMRKRRAWGCGFCAAMHTKLEKHYEHVASHFESGAQKPDWLHSNVIYGLLHQPAVLEAWKDLINRKQGKFNGHQPMFSWSLDNTGRQQGYVENENPGQLQDFLEFFDGSTESAEKIARCAWGYCHVVLKPKSSPADNTPTHQDAMSMPAPDSCSLSRQVTITSQSRGLRRVSSTSLMPINRQPSRRMASTEFRDHHMSGISYTSPIEQNSNPYQSFMVPSQQIPSQPMQSLQVEQVQISQHRPLSLDKELPPAPLLPSPMDVDFNMFGNEPQQEQMMKVEGMEDWQSFNSTLIDEQTMAGQAMNTQNMAGQAMATPNMATQHMVTQNMAGQAMGNQNQAFHLSWENLGHYAGVQQ